MRQAIEEAGYTDEQVFADPTCIQEILYKLNLEEVLAGLNAPDAYISTPTESQHVLSIKFNPETGKFEVLSTSLVTSFASSNFPGAFLVALRSLRWFFLLLCP